MASEVNLQIKLSSTVDHILNWDLHCSTATPEVHRTKHLFLTVHAAVTPTRVLPAPVTFTTQKYKLVLYYTFLMLRNGKTFVMKWLAAASPIR